MRLSRLLPVVLLACISCGPTDEGGVAPVPFSQRSDASYPVPLGADPGSQVTLQTTSGATIPTDVPLVADAEGQLQVPAAAQADLKKRYPSFVALAVINGERRRFLVNLVDGELVTALDPNRPPAAETPRCVFVRAGDRVRLIHRSAFTDRDRDRVSLAISAPPVHGAAEFDQDGWLAYAAGSSYVGTDAFAITADDGHGGRMVADIAVRVVRGWSVEPEILVPWGGQGLEVGGFSRLVLKSLGSGASDCSLSLAASPDLMSVSLGNDDVLRVADPGALIGGIPLRMRIVSPEGAEAEATATLRRLPPLLTVANDPAGGPEDGPVETRISASGESGLPVSVTIAGRPAHAAECELVKDGDAWRLRYVPAKDWNGTDAVTVTATDGIVTATHRIDIRIDPVDDVPSFPQPEPIVALESQETAGRFIASDPDGTVLAFRVTRPPEWGELTVQADGRYAWSAPVGSVGETSADVEVSDGVQAARVTVVLRSIFNASVNHPPILNVPPAIIAPPGELSLYLDESLGQTVVDPDGDAFRVTIGRQPDHGTLARDQWGRLCYRSDERYSGEDSFELVATDSRGASTTKTVIAHVEGRQTVSGFSTPWNAPLSVSGFLKRVEALFGVSRPGARWVLSRSHSRCAVTTADDGSAQIVPERDYAGQAYVYVTVAYPDGAERLISVRVDVDGPEFTSSMTGFFTDEDVSTRFEFRAQSASGRPVSYEYFGMPEHGRVTNIDASTGAFSYSPNPDYNGEDAVFIRARDGIGFKEFTVPVRVRPVADVPVFTGPGLIASLQSVTASGSFAATDADGDSVTWHVVAAPAFGSLTVQPDGRYAWLAGVDDQGDTSAVVELTDGTSTVRQSVTLRATYNAGVNHPPSRFTGARVADMDDEWDTARFVGFGDPDGDVAKVAALVASGGTAAVAADGRGFKAKTGVPGDFNYAWSLDDGRGGIREGNSLRVFSAPNLHPTFVAEDLSPITFKLQDIAIPLKGPLGTPEVSLSPWTSDYGALKDNGDGTWSFVPNRAAAASKGWTSMWNWSPFTLRYGGGILAEGRIVFWSGMRRPSISQSSFSIDEGSAASGALSVPSQTSGGALALRVVSSPSKGDVTVDGYGYRYQSRTGSYGEDGFTLQAYDAATGAKFDFPVSVAVKHVNHRPVITVPPSVDVTQGERAEGHLVATDVDGDAIAWDRVPPGSYRIMVYDGFTLRGDGSWTYQAAAPVGQASFDVYAMDPSGAYAKSQLRFNVLRVNHAPVTTDVALSVTAAKILEGWCSANDQDKDPITYAVGDQPAHGALSFDQAGGWAYVPAKGYVGEDRFTYRASDGYGGTAVGTVAITVKSETALSGPTDVAAGELTGVEATSQVAVDLERARAEVDRIAGEAAGLTSVKDVRVAETATAAQAVTAITAQREALQGAISAIVTVSNDAASSDLASDEAAQAKASSWNLTLGAAVATVGNSGEGTGSGTGGVSGGPSDSDGAPVGTPPVDGGPDNYAALSIVKPAAVRTVSAASSPDEINPVGKAKVEAKVADLHSRLAVIDGQIAQKEVEISGFDATYRQKSAEARAAYDDYLAEKAVFQAAQNTYSSKLSSYRSDASAIAGSVSLPAAPDTPSVSAGFEALLSLSGRLDALAVDADRARNGLEVRIGNFQVPDPTSPLSAANQFGPGEIKKWSDRYLGADIVVATQYSSSSTRDYPAKLYEAFRLDGVEYAPLRTFGAYNDQDLWAIGPKLQELVKLRVCERVAARAASSLVGMSDAAQDMAVSALFEELFQNYQSATSAANAALAAKSAAETARGQLDGLRSNKGKIESDLARVSDVLAKHGWYLDERGRVTNDLLAAQREAEDKEKALKDAEDALKAKNDQLAAARVRVDDLESQLPTAPADTLFGTFTLGGRQFRMTVPVAGLTAEQARAALEAAIASAKARTSVESLPLTGQAKDKSAWAYVWRDPSGAGSPYAFTWGYGTCWDQSVGLESVACSGQADVDAAKGLLEAKIARIDVTWNAEPLASGGGIRFLTRPVVDGAAWPKIVEARYVAGVGGIEIPLYADGAANYEDQATASRDGTPGAATVKGMKDALRAKAAAFRKAAGVAYAGATYDVYSDGRAWWARYRLANAATGAWAYVQPRADRASCEAAVKAAVDGSTSTENPTDTLGETFYSLTIDKLLKRQYDVFQQEVQQAREQLLCAGPVPSSACMPQAVYRSVLEGKEVPGLSDYGIRKASDGGYVFAFDGKEKVLYSLSLGMAGAVGTVHGAAAAVKDTIASSVHPIDALVGTAEGAYAVLDGTSELLADLMMRDLARNQMHFGPQDSLIVAFWGQMYLQAEARCQIHRQDLLELSAFIAVVEKNPDDFLALLPTADVTKFTGLDPVGYNRGYAEGYVIGQFVQIPALFKVGKITGAQALKVFTSPVAKALIARSKALVKDNIAIFEAASVIRSVSTNKIDALLGKFGWPGLTPALAGVENFEGLDEIADVLGEYDHLRDAGKTFMEMEPFRAHAAQAAQSGEITEKLISYSGYMARWRGWAEGMSIADIRAVLAAAEGGAYTGIAASDVGRLYNNGGKSVLGYLVGVAQRRVSIGFSEFDRIVLYKMARGEVETVQLHHFLTDKFSGSANYTRQFLERLTEAFPSRTWNLDEPWNLEWVVNHHGRHTERYSEIMLDRLKEIIAKTKPDESAFFREFEALKLKVAKDPVGYGLINE